MKKLAPIAYVIAIAYFLASLFKKEYDKIMNYSIRVKDIDVKDITSKKVGLTLFLGFMNRSSIDFRFKKQSYFIYFRDVLISSAVVKQYINIESEKETIIPINISIDLDKIKKIPNFASSLRDIKIDIKLQSNTLGIPVKIEFEYRTSLTELIYQSI